jgi:hypothetical protein
VAEKKIQFNTAHRKLEWYLSFSALSYRFWQEELESIGDAKDRGIDDNIAGTLLLGNNTRLLRYNYYESIQTRDRPTFRGRHVKNESNQLTHHVNWEKHEQYDLGLKLVTWT